MKTNRWRNPRTKTSKQRMTTTTNVPMPHGVKAGKKTARDHRARGTVHRALGIEKAIRIDHEEKGGTATARVHHGKAIGRMLRDVKGTVAHNRRAMVNEAPATDRATENAVRNRRAARCRTET